MIQHYDRYWDTRLEVLDPETGTVIASTVLDRYVQGFTSSGDLITYRFREGMIPTAEIFQARLINPRGGPFFPRQKISPLIGAPCAVDDDIQYHGGSLPPLRSKQSSWTVTASGSEGGPAGDLRVHRRFGTTPTGRGRWSFAEHGLNFTT
jgi:hypothetical protein